MTSKTLHLFWLAIALNVAPAWTESAAASAQAPSQAAIRISIKNEYNVKLDFGPLGKGTRDGIDSAGGVLNRQGRDYVGIVTANVISNQLVSGLGRACGPAQYRDSQKLRVTGRIVGGFSQAQSVAFNQPTSPSNASTEYLSLEFAPETRTSQEPANSDPETGQRTVSCHDLIETPSGKWFLPLNDARWTQEGGGYVIALPSSGVLDYTDTTVPQGTMPIGPLQVKSSVWTVRVERLP